VQSPSSQPPQKRPKKQKGKKMFEDSSRRVEGGRVV